MLVTILYGPYEANGIIRHRIQRMYGLTEALKTLEIQYEMIPLSKLNRLEISICNRTIMSADIRNLKFNIAADSDVVCQRIVKSIQEHIELFTAPFRKRSFDETWHCDSGKSDTDRTSFLLVPHNSSIDHFYPIRNDDLDGIQQTQSQKRINYKCDLESIFAIETSDVCETKQEKETESHVTLSEYCDYLSSISPSSYYNVCHRAICPLTLSLVKKNGELFKRKEVMEQVEKKYGPDEITSFTNGELDPFGNTETNVTFGKFNENLIDDDKECTCKLKNVENIKGDEPEHDKKDDEDISSSEVEKDGLIISKNEDDFVMDISSLDEEVFSELLHIYDYELEREVSGRSIKKRLIEIVKSEFRTNIKESNSRMFEKSAITIEGLPYYSNTSESQQRPAFFSQNTFAEDIYSAATRPTTTSGYSYYAEAFAKVKAFE